ncbi:MAG: BlaI/MecI/CopY family transcriptional regulator [Planctomycetota bacterium]
MNSEPPPITDAEWDVMDVLWRKSPMTAQDVHEDLAARREWSLGTVKTLLTRLSRKGALKHIAEGKRFLYRPAVTKRACVRAAGKDLLRRAGRDAESPLLTFFLKESRLQREEIDALRALLDRIEGGQR